jgi:lysophospholipase L1-like esterase
LTGLLRHRSQTQRAALLASASVAISLVLSLGALEGALRVYHRLKEWREQRALPPVAARAMVPSRDPELIYEWNPGWSRDGFSVNSLGMADREVTLEKPPGVFRIAFFGDSISANFGHRPRPEIYLNVLGRRLDEEAWRGARFEVLNFGVNGYSLLQSVRMLESRALPFAPDLAVVQLCLNDPYPSNTPYASLMPTGPSRLWSFFYRRLFPDRFWGWAYVESAYDETGVGNLRRGIARLAELARRGPPILAVLFPYLNAPAYDEWGFERFHEIYRDAARESGLPLLDLYPPFRRAGAIGKLGIADPIHPGREAHEVAAAEIEIKLDELKLLPAAGG